MSKWYGRLLRESRRYKSPSSSVFPMAAPNFNSREPHPVSLSSSVHSASIMLGLDTTTLSSLIIALGGYVQHFRGLSQEISC